MATSTAFNDGLPTLDPRSLDPRTPVIVGFARTPQGSFLGALSSLSAPELGGAAIAAALARANGSGNDNTPTTPSNPNPRLSPSDVDEVLMGCVCSANLGQAPASQAARLGGLPDTVPATLVNKVCASGLKAVALAAQAVRSGSAECVVAGGMESMSRVPHYAPGLRTGAMRLGHSSGPGPEGGLVDGLLRDGLWCAVADKHMGECAEMAAEKYGVAREAQDEAALATFARARRAEASGAVRREIAPVKVAAAREGGSGGGVSSTSSYTVIDRDEPLGRLDESKLRALRPYFRHDRRGTVTAGNASPLTDGAAAAVVVSARLAAERGLPVLAAVRSWADANGPPEWFSTAPSKAAPLALEKAGGLKPADVDYWEVNEAFMVVDLVNRRLLGLEDVEVERRLAGAGGKEGGKEDPSPPPSRVNAHGGAVALGHAIGASGAVLVGRLVNVLRSEGGKIGCAVICNGGGGASALVLECAGGRGDNDRAAP
jgi:acetyl-CoA C-acetyltransferase